MLLPHLASRLYGTPLLLARSKLDIILAVLGSRVGWSESESSLSRIALPAVRTSQQAMAGAPDGIAVVPVHGSLVRRAIGVDAASGLTSYAEIAAMLDAAVADPMISGVLLEIDSPGGEAGGVFELAARIRELGRIKPIWAIASDSAFSAAYALACAASRVFVTQTGGVGSIGVIAMHVDQSVRDAQQGYRFTAVTAGERKNDLSAHEPITKAALSALQGEVDRLYGLFVDEVASMRSIDAKAVRAQQAALYFGGDAVAAGLADGVASYEQVMSEFAAYLSAQRVRGQAARVISATAALLDEPTDELTAQQPQPVASISFNQQEEIQMNPKPENPCASEVVANPVDEAAPTLAPAKEKPLPPDSVEPVVAAAVPSVTDEVLSNDAIAAASTASAAHARSQAVAIAELCLLAGQSARIAAFLSSGATQEQVRSALLASRAASCETNQINSLIHPDSPARSDRTVSGDQNLLLQAVKKLTPSSPSSTSTLNH